MIVSRRELPNADKMDVVDSVKPEAALGSEQVEFDEGRVNTTGAGPAASAEELVRRAYQAFSERDLDTLRKIAGPEVEIHTVTGMLAGRAEPYRGYEGIAEYLDDVAKLWDEIELMPSDFHQLSDDRLVVFGRVRARRELAVIDAPTAWLWEFEEGRVRSARVFGDPQAAREALG
jgi:ketosteroid isomerase-like protein